MIGAHANTVLSDWIIKEGKKVLSKDQMETIMGYMLRNANNQTEHDDRPNPVSYLAKGYITYESAKHSGAS